MRIKNLFSKKILAQNSKVIILGCLLGLGVGYLQATYGPPSGPPSDVTNIKYPPLNVGSDKQVKFGTLNVNKGVVGTNNSEASLMLTVGGGTQFKNNLDLSGIVEILDKKFFTGKLTVGGNLQLLNFFNPKWRQKL